MSFKGELAFILKGHCPRMHRCFEGEAAVKYGKHNKHKLLSCFANNFLVSRPIQAHAMQGWAARPAASLLDRQALPKVQMLPSSSFL